MSNAEQLAAAIREYAKERNQGVEPDELHIAYETELLRLRVENEMLAAQAVRLQQSPPTIVWVVYTDGGPSGPIIHGVYTEQPSPGAISQYVNMHQRTPEGYHFCVATGSGYQSTRCDPIVLDGPFVPSGEPVPLG